MKKLACQIIIVGLLLNNVFAGLLIRKGDGVRFTGADGIEYIGIDSIRFTGADGLLAADINGVRFTGADGTRFTGADGVRFTGADGVTYTGANGVRFTGADSANFASADSIRLVSPNGVRFTGADGVSYQANSILILSPRLIAFVRPNGLSFVGVDGLRFTGADADFERADGGRINSADFIKLGDAATVLGYNSNGVVFQVNLPRDFLITSPDGNKIQNIEILITRPDGARFTGADGYQLTNEIYRVVSNGLQSLDPDLAVKLDRLTDDSSINAIIVFHDYPSAADLQSLFALGIQGGTLFRVLPMVAVTTTKARLIAASQLPNVRSIYGNRTLKFDYDPYLRATQVQRIATDSYLQQRNFGMPVLGRNVTVAVLDTGINATHGDLLGRVVQNVRLIDSQSVAVGFVYPTPIENLQNTDLISGHGTFVAGLIAGSGSNSSGRYKGVAPAARLLGLSAGDLSLFHILSGFDYLLYKGSFYNVKVVNCSFSSDSAFDFNDPVNIATYMLTQKGISVVFSAGNNGPSNGTLNPYAIAPWVISVGATDENGRLADFSSRGVLGSKLFRPSIVAPGVNLVSLRSIASQISAFGVALGDDLQRLTPNELPFYTTASGTSFSAPQVAGTIALMLEVNPNLTPAQIKDILQRSATPLPSNYAHEVGAGMLNSYAAVLEAANPRNRMGGFRSIFPAILSFTSSQAQNFAAIAIPGSESITQLSIPSNVLHVDISISWRNPLNDLSLKVYDQNGNLIAQSNYINTPFLSGRLERVTIKNPLSHTLKVVVTHSSAIGSAEEFAGTVKITKIDFPQFTDLSQLNQQDASTALEGLQKLIIFSEGDKLSPTSKVLKGELAESLVRSGIVPQYLAASPMYSDVRDIISRTAVESCQFSQFGKLIPDSSTENRRFGYFDPATKLILAVALVKASGKEDEAGMLQLSGSVSDYSAIPIQYRGHVAFALQKGWLSLDGNLFSPNRPVTRIELARAILSFLNDRMN